MQYLKSIFRTLFPSFAKLIKACIEFKRIYALSPFRRLVIFDVGANDGNNFIDLSRLPWIDVHAFEPTPELTEIILRKSQGRPNYFVNEVAISDVEGELTFNVAVLGDWGCSSL